MTYNPLSPVSMRTQGSTKEPKSGSEARIQICPAVLSRTASKPRLLNFVIAFLEVWVMQEIDVWYGVSHESQFFLLTMALNSKVGQYWMVLEYGTPYFEPWYSSKYFPRYTRIFFRISRNVDVVLIAGAAIHYLFDQHHWLLLPDQDIVDKYRQSLTETGRQAIRESFPIIEAVCLILVDMYIFCSNLLIRIAMFLNIVLYQYHPKWKWFP